MVILKGKERRLGIDVLRKCFTRNKPENLGSISVINPQSRQSKQSNYGKIVLKDGQTLNEILLLVSLTLLHSRTSR